MFAELGGLKVPLGAGGTHISVTNKLLLSNCGITPIQMINPRLCGQFMAYFNCTSTPATPFNEPFRHTVWENQHIVPQLDLYKMNHYDNPNRRTSLKDLEFNIVKMQVVVTNHDTAVFF
jgi:hypothetical protein